MRTLVLLSLSLLVFTGSWLCGWWHRESSSSTKSVVSVGTADSSARDRVVVGDDLSSGPAASEPVGSSMNPAARLATLLGQQPSSRRQLEFRLALLDLDRGQLDGVWASLRAREGGEPDDFDLAQAVLLRLAEFDPELAIVRAAELGSAGGELLPRILAVWSRTDLDSALEHVRTTDGAMRRASLVAVLEDAGGRDRRAALELFRDLIQEDLVAPGAWEAESFFREWSRRDPRQAATEALALRQLTRSDFALEVTLGTWARQDAASALDWLEESIEDGPHRHEMLLPLVRGWARSEPTAAGDYAVDIADRRTRNQALVQILSDWVPAGFAEAAEWVLRLEEGDAKRYAEYALVNESRFTGNPEEGLEYAISRHTENRGLSHAIYMHSLRVLTTDPEESFAWIDETFDDPLLEEALTTSVLHKIRDENPKLALQHIDRMQEPLYRADLYRFFSSLWAEQDRLAARAYVDSLPPSYDRTWATAGVFGQVLSEDPTAARAWMEETSSGPELDEFQERYSLWLARRGRIEDALELASRIGGHHLRDFTLERVHRRWLGKSPAEARRAIRSNRHLSSTSRWRLLGDE